MFDDNFTYDWHFVNGVEANALRNGKPYKLDSHDLNRLYMADWLGAMGGDPNRDALTIILLRKGWIVKNPTRIIEEAEVAKRIFQLKTTYSEGQYTIGTGFCTYEWKLTPEGEKAIRAILAQYGR